MISPRSIVAPLIALEDRKLLAARARLAARDPTVILSPAELNSLADIADGSTNRSRGGQSKPTILKRSKSLETARVYAWFRYGKYGKEIKHDCAVAETKKELRRAEGTIEGELRFARKYLGGAWWPDLLRKASKGERRKLSLTALPRTTNATRARDRAIVEAANAKHRE
jgi:hypothetical protein